MKWVLHICMTCVLAVSAHATELPDAAEVLKRVEARLQAICDLPATNQLFYTRTNIIEETDGGGSVKHRTTKTYEINQLQGLPRARLVALDGRTLSASEQRWHISQEQRLQRTLAQDKSPDYDKPKPWIDDDILERFQFKVVGRTNHLRRIALIIEFSPRADAPNRSMVDRIVNKISGSLWVDELESEIVQLNMRVTEPVKFWGGILGQLDRFDWTLQRRRTGFGVWYNDVSNGTIQIRKLFATSRFKISEEAANVRAENKS